MRSNHQKKQVKAFYFSSLLLPQHIRDQVIVLYAWCRFVDDAIDEAPSIEEGLKNCSNLKSTVTKIYNNEYTASFDCDSEDNNEQIVNSSFSDLVHNYNISKCIPDYLIEGQEWDCRGKVYETLDDLIGYCERVAASVGLAMCQIMDAPLESYSYACALGVAMQLTNIARDVGEDARRGRIYLPLKWLREENIHLESQLDIVNFGNNHSGRRRKGNTNHTKRREMYRRHQKPIDLHFTPALGRVVKRLLETADEFYAVAERGIRMLPSDCQLAILTACRVYRSIGDEIANHDYDSVSSRSSTSLTRKLYLLTTAIWDNSIVSSIPSVKTYWPVSALFPRHQSILPYERYGYTIVDSMKHYPPAQIRCL